MPPPSEAPRSRGPSGGSAETRERIAIVRLSALGDVILALPVLEGLRAARPDAHITWIVEPLGARLLADHPALDQVLVFPRAATRALWPPRTKTFGALAQLRAFFASLRRQRFDLVFDLQGNLKSGLVTRSTGAPRRIGFAAGQTREPNAWSTHEQLQLDDRPIHRSEQDLALVRKAGIEATWRPARLGIDESRVLRAEALWDDPPGSASKRLILQPGTSARMPHKRWPAERWGALAAALIAQQPQLQVLVHHGPGERALAEAIARSCPTVRLTPKGMDLLDLAALLGGCDLLIGGDTGPTHLAEVLGRPVLTLLGPTDPRLYYPYGHPERALFRRVGCAPCRWRTCEARVCMDQIEVARVVDMALRIVASDDDPQA